MPRLPRDEDGHARQDRLRLPLERGAPLPFVDEQHFIPIAVAVDGDGGPGQERFGSHTEGTAGAPGINFHDHFAGRRRTELEDLALAGLQDVAHRNLA